MKIVCTLILGALLLITGTVAQQPGPAQDVPKFDPQKQETFTGVVSEVKNYHCPVTGTLGAHLAVKAYNGVVYEAHLAPADFMKEFGISFKPADVITITGTKVTFDGKPAVLARVIKYKNETYLFRDEKGRPLW